MTNKKRQWLATRVLEDAADPAVTIEVFLGYPEKLENEPHWRCAFRVNGINGGKIAYAPGTDALQALMNALEGMATVLRESGRAITWMGIDHLIRRHVPGVLGSEFANEIEAFIDAKLEAYGREKRRALAKRRKARGSQD
jgi:hypothetical protein